MKQLLARGIPPIITFFLFLQTSLSAAGPGASITHRDSWLASRACAIVSNGSPTDAENTICPGLDDLVARAHEAVTGASGPPDTLDRLNRFFFQTEKFQVTYDLSSSDHLLPGPVITGKKGYCVGLATVYLLLARELGLPVHAVATPKHVFLRWDDGKLRRNIELFQEGREVPDADYMREQKIPQESIDHGIFLANLTDKEFPGFIYQNLGVLESQQGDYQDSGKHYAKALKLNKKLEAAYYNRGNDELKQKQYRKAIRDYDKALKLYSGDPWAMQNRSLAQHGLSNPRESIKKVPN